MKAWVLLLALWGGPSAAWAGPWSKSAGQLYLKAWEGAYLANGFVGRDGRFQEGADHLSLTSALYGEVGVWDRLQVQAFLPYVIGRNTFDSGNRFLAAGGGDLLLGAQWSPALQLFPAALRLEGKVPLYDVAQPKGYAAAQFPLRGDGQIDLTAWASVGLPPLDLPLYAFVEFGYRLRTEAFIGEGAPSRSFADSLVTNAQVGLTPIGRFVFAANVGGVLPLADDAYTKGYLSLGLSVYAPVWEGLALEANFDALTLAKNSANGLSFGLGVSYAL